MLKKTLAFALITASLVSISNGSTTRLQSLLVRGFIEDDSDIFTNPALVAYYPNLVIGELGVYSSYESSKQASYLPCQWLGITHGMASFAGGLVFNRDIPMVDVIATYDMRDEVPFYHPIEPMNPIEVMGAYAVDGMAVGARVYRIGAGSTDETYQDQPYGSLESKTTESSGIWDLAGGIQMNMGEGSKLEGYFNFGLLSFSSEYEVTVSDTVGPDTTYTDVTKDESEGGKYIAFGGRWFLPVTRRMQFVPIVEFSTGSFTETAESPGTTHPDIENKRMSFMGGIGVNTKLSRHSTLVVGVSTTYCSEKQEQEDDWTDETTTFTLPLFQAGLETNLTRWFIARMGVQKAHAKITEKYFSEGGGSKQEYESTQTRTASPLDFLSLGFGIRLDRFLLDATLMEEIPFTGTYLLSGISENLCGQITATYHF